jgi:hypothetical protein
MSLAELAIAVWALERYECFLATCFTFHGGETPCSLLKADDRLYVSLELPVGVRASLFFFDVVKICR